MRRHVRLSVAGIDVDVCLFAGGAGGSGRVCLHCRTGRRPIAAPPQRFLLQLHHAQHRRLRRYHPGVERGADAGGDGSHHRHALRGGAHLPVGGALFVRETSVGHAEALILTQTKVVTMNTITQNIESKLSTLCRKAVARSFLKAILASLLLADAIEGPVLAQTIKAVDDGTVLKQIIIFGRHSIRSATSGTNSLGQCSANPFPDFVGVPVGYLTPRGQLAAGLMGSYFHDYLLHEGLLTGDASSDLAHSYFRANVIERSYMTAAKFGAKLIPGANIPVHTYPTNPAVADPVFDPLLATNAIVDPVRALTEVQGVFGSGTNLSSAYSGELSLISKVLYPPGTHPLYPGTSPTNNAPPGSFDPITVPITLTTNVPPYYTGNVINMGGLYSTVTAADPFVMQYADGYRSEEHTSELQF